MTRWVAVPLLAIGVSGLFLGCSSSKSPPSSGETSANSKAPGNAGSTSETGSAGSASTSASAGTEESADGKVWKEFPDVPYVAVMTEIGGIRIPRLETKAQTLQLKGKLPADEGNAHAQAKPSKPEKGDWLVVRFNSEPKSLNPIVETSAVQTYIGEYVQEALARLNPETLEYEPNIAERWVTEDAVKLSSDYPGQERRVAVGDAQPAAEGTLDYPKKKDENDEKEKPAEIAVATFDKDGKPAPNTWIGLYPAEKIVGAPVSGYHYWSDAAGKFPVAGIVPGKYTVKVGAELYGKATKKDDGSLVVDTESPKASSTLKKGEWVDVQEQTIYTYFLRKDVKWSDGQPFTTKDMLFGFATINNSFVDGESIRVYYQDIIDCTALDDYTIRMKYRQQYFKSFEFTMGLSAYSPPFHVFAKFFEEDGKALTLDKLTKEEEESQKKVSVHGQAFGKFFNNDNRYNEKPIGTGPYMVDKWVKDDRVELVRNPNYWNKERGGYLDRLVFKFIPDNVTAFQALKSGEIDFFWNMDTEQYHRDLAGPPEWFSDKYVKAKWFSPGFGYVGWNLLKPKFQDQKVRVALGLLFDKQEFLEKKMYGDGAIVTGSQYYFGPGYDHAVKPLAYDPDAARELLADAGWIDSNGDGVLDKDGQPFQFEYLLPPGNKLGKERATIYQENLKNVGIKMEIREYEWASFIEKVKAKDYDVVSLGWAQPLESDPYQIWHSSGAGADKRGSNHVSFADPLADQLIEQLRLTLDEKKRSRINDSLHRILDREQPYMFLFLPMDHGAYHKRFRGVKWYRVRPGFDFTEWYVPKDEQTHKSAE